MGNIVADYVVVGAGLTGSTLARCLADAGREVLVLERRSEPGGNVRDSLHPSGIRLGIYGPHYFRCSSPRIWDYVTRFAKFRPFQAHIMALIDGEYEEWPINQRHLDRYPDWSPLKTDRPPKNFEEACLRKVPPEIYRDMIEGYTRKQWGVDPGQLNATLARRIRINPSTEHTLASHHRHQALPIGGYSAWAKQMVTGIPCLCNMDFCQIRDEICARRLLIYTGSVDEFFGFDEGRLSYRSQHRTEVYYQTADWMQPCVQVNYPKGDDKTPIRTIEWKHLLPPEETVNVRGTVITREDPYTPNNPDDFEYPFPSRANEALYRRYRRRVECIPKLMVCGRLGEYRYYDMDQAIGRALLIADRLLGVKRFVRQVTLMAKV